MLSLEKAKALKPCECGCGGMFEPIDKKGRPRRFLPGHSARVNHGMIGRKASNRKGGRVTKQGYKIIYIPLTEREHHTHKKDGYTFEHRYVMEKHLGRKLKKYEVVHHVNGNKLDNRIENLELMTINSHAFYESKKRPVNWKCIEAMQQKNIKKVKSYCSVDGCDNIVKSNSLCNKHHHLYRKGKLLFTDNGIVIKKGRLPQKAKVKECAQCGVEFISYSNRGKYCERCRTPYQFIKRQRAKKKEMKNSVIS